MLSISDTEFASLISQWLYPFMRIAGLMMTAPVIGTRVVPGKIRVVVAIAIALVIVPLAAVPDNIEVFSFAGLLVAAQQVLVGALIGVVLRLVFLVVELAGQIIAQQMGLGFASLVDPQTGLQVPVFSLRID